MSVDDPKAPGAGADESHGYADPHAYPEDTPVHEPAPKALGPVRRDPPPPPPIDPEDAEDEGMLRMSFLGHLEELRTRIIRSLMGLAVAFFGTMYFANDLWRIVSAPATLALRHLGFQDKLVQITPMESFTTVWVKLPMLASLFIASPWLLYQVWSFIAPGLYKRERRWAVPFVMCSAGLFIAGGLFAYFVAFRYGIEFLLGIGRDINIQPMVSITEYFDLFVNVTLGIGVVFELPILIFFLTLLRIVTPKFLISHSRYAILAIVIIAAIVTPTPDVFNLMMFAIPMCLLYFIGVFAGYLLVLRRENRRFPWVIVALIVLVILLVVAGAAAVAIWKFGFKLLNHWPYLAR